MLTETSLSQWHFSLQPLKSWLCFLPLPLYHWAGRPSWFPPSLLIATFCAFSCLLPETPSSESLVIRLYHPYPSLIPMSISSMAISLYFMTNVSLGLLSYSQYYSILNSGQFNTHVHYPSKYAGFLMIWASLSKILSSTLLNPLTPMIMPQSFVSTKVYNFPIFSKPSRSFCDHPHHLFSSLSSSPSLIILHPHPDFQIRRSYYRFPNVLSSLFTQLKFHAHLLVCAGFSSAQIPGTGKGKVKEKKKTKNLTKPQMAKTKVAISEFFKKILF